MWEPALSSPMSWNSMSCTTVPESQSSPESPECGRSAAEATSQTLKKSSAWIQNIFPSGISDWIRIAAKESETDRDRILSASFHGKTKKWDAEVTGEDGWENSFAGMSSIFIPAKEILSHSYNLNAATEKNNVRFDDTYLDIINAAKINISAGRNSASKEAMLKIIEKMTQGTVTGYSNTGGFGIDGSLSTVIGAALCHPDRLYYCVLGDLAFFYDMNALGNRHVPSNIRILVVNNGLGFEMKFPASWGYSILASE